MRRRMPIRGSIIGRAVVAAARDLGRRLGRALPLGLALAVALGGGLASIVPAAAEPRPAIAMHGAPRLTPGWDHVPWADPAAPKGGRITLGVVGSFDQLNPFVFRGNPAAGLRGGAEGSNVFESLMDRGLDEPFTLYGLLAETIDVADDLSTVTFRLDPAARFSDRTPVTPEDVVFSFETLREKGLPYMRANYRDVEGVEKVDDRTVRFRLKSAENRELPLILGLMPILPAHDWKDRDFEATRIDPPIGSGPYRVTTVEPGARLVLTRDPDYWAKDRPVRRGLYNADELRWDYYRDRNSMIESFKKGLVDLTSESDPGRWSTAYDFPAAREGLVVKETIPLDVPRGMTGFALNTRRPLFADVRVREALARLFDFEWANRNLFWGLYERQHGYFDGSELSAYARPADDRERALLAPFPGAIAPAFLDGSWRMPTTDGSGRDRAALKAAFELLKAAGWRLDGARLVSQTGAPFSFEILTQTREQERLAMGWQRTLAALGIDARIRTVDAAQYESRRRTFDFDVTLWVWAASASPGNEQIHRWSTGAADQEGSFNLPGVKNPVADAAITALIGARSRDDLVAAARLLDRVLMAGFYVVPLYHLPGQWLAHWTRIEHPANTPGSGWTLPAWWVRPDEKKEGGTP
ncbi:extracellular solute-binding protein [Pinisolibacter aquiterrae]|uniref:extracellular solute-binding protein n=2 Tax=Pinisolibacter aquiterrae TaxID=2815579 RepID=UPI001E559755|nr:extracellular solute-binding protein [Pinisolibacter aquiterrae]